jgi:hypothetical protein
MFLSGNAVQLSKNYAKSTHSTTDNQKNFVALYRATPCLQSKADRDRSGCDEMPYIPMPEGRGFTAYLVKPSTAATALSNRPTEEVGNTRKFFTRSYSAARKVLGNENGGAVKSSRTSLSAPKPLAVCTG